MVKELKRTVVERGKRKINNITESWKRFKGNKTKFGLFIAGIASLLLIIWRASAATGILVWMFAKTMQEVVFKIVPGMSLSPKGKMRKIAKMTFIIVTPALIAQQLTIGYFGVLALVFVGANNYLSDTGAYYFGKHMPKRWLSQLSKASPNKTWGGALFGVLLSFSVCYGAYVLMLLHITIYFGAHIFILPHITNKIILGTNPNAITIMFFIGACVNIRGDLWGSKQKRLAHIKDSSSDLGSHGGYFDKTDGLVWCLWFWDICFIRYSHTFATIKTILIHGTTLLFH